jgi:hypothetical protein
MQAAADGAELPIRDDKDPEWGAIVARYVDPNYVAVLWVYEDDSEETGWHHDIVVYQRLADGQLEHAATGGSDWFGAPGTRPREHVWLSGFRCGNFDGPTFVTGAVLDLEYLRLFRHFSTGEAVAERDAPTGAFVARID